MLRSPKAREHAILDLGVAAALLVATGIVYLQVAGHGFVSYDDGTYVVDLTVDVDALALGVSPTIDSADLAAQLRALPPAELDALLERFREMIQRRVRIEFDGREQSPLVSMPHHGTPLADDADEPTVLGTIVRLTGRIPAGAESFTFRASRTFQAVHLTIFDQATAAGAKFILAPSEQSPPYRLGQTPAPAGRRGPAGRGGRLTCCIAASIIRQLPPDPLPSKNRHAPAASRSART